MPRGRSRERGFSTTTARQRSASREDKQEGDAAEKKRLKELQQKLADAQLDGATDLSLSSEKFKVVPEPLLLVTSLRRLSLADNALTKLLCRWGTTLPHYIRKTAARHLR